MRFPSDRDGVLLPEVAIYQTVLTLISHAASSAKSGINAIAPVVEALCVRDHHSIVVMMPMSVSAQGCPTTPLIAATSRRGPRHFSARGCPGRPPAPPASPHYKVCHTLGSFDLLISRDAFATLPHSGLHADSVPEVATFLQAALSHDKAARALYAPAASLTGPRRVQYAQHAFNTLSMPKTPTRLWPDLTGPSDRSDAMVHGHCVARMGES